MENAFSLLSAAVRYDAEVSRRHPYTQSPVFVNIPVGRDGPKAVSSVKGSVCMQTNERVYHVVTLASTTKNKVHSPWLAE